MPEIQYSFGTGESDPNVHSSEANVDVNGDGTADGVALDFDGDGRVDDVMWDSDGDGVADTALLDQNDDGVAEDAYHDPTGMGTWNAHGQGSAQQQPAPEQEPQPQPSPGPNDTGQDDPVTPEGDTTDADNGYEPYGTGAEEEDSDEGAEAPEASGNDENSGGPELPGAGSDDSSDDTTGESTEYEPREEDGDDANGLFDTLEDAPDVDRDSISEWYDDMMT